MNGNYTFLVYTVDAFKIQVSPLLKMLYFMEGWIHFWKRQNIFSSHFYDKSGIISITGAAGAVIRFDDQKLEI